MAILGWPELILVLAILIFIFGASRMRDLAKGLGESVREFKKATSDQPEKRERDDKKEAIIEAAKKLGIETEGKGIDQILREMNERVSKT